MAPEEQVDGPKEASTALVLRIPETALIPEGATFYEGEDDGRCRLVRADGQRCRASRTRMTGMCPGHSGLGEVATDPSTASQRAAKTRSDRRATRLLLGVSARRAAQPVQAARMAAQMRAQDFATAVVDGPLDDPELGTVARQQAAIRALELLYPQVTASVEVDMPAEQAGMQEMGWEQLQALASQLLGEGHQGGTDAPLDRMVEPNGSDVEAR